MEMMIVFTNGPNFTEMGLNGPNFYSSLKLQIIQIPEVRHSGPNLGQLHCVQQYL